MACSTEHARNHTAGPAVRRTWKHVAAEGSCQHPQALSCQPCLQLFGPTAHPSFFSTPNNEEWKMVRCGRVQPCCAAAALLPASRASPPLWQELLLPRRPSPHARAPPCRPPPRQVRKSTAPAFSPDNIRRAFPTVLGVANEVCDVLAAQLAARRDEVDITDAAMRLLLDVIGQTGYGWVAGRGPAVLRAWWLCCAVLRWWPMGTQRAVLGLPRRLLNARAQHPAGNRQLAPAGPPRRYDFKAREFGPCELFEVGQPGLRAGDARSAAASYLAVASDASLRLASKIGSPRTASAWCNSCRREIFHPAPLLHLPAATNARARQALPPVLAEFTARGTDPTRKLVHQLMPWLEEARLFKERVKVRSARCWAGGTVRQAHIEKAERCLGCERAGAGAAASQITLPCGAACCVHVRPHCCNDGDRTAPATRRCAGSGGTCWWRLCGPPTWQRQRRRATPACASAWRACLPTMSCCAPTWPCTWSAGKQHPNRTRRTPPSSGGRRGGQNRTACRGPGLAQLEPAMEDPAQPQQCT